MLLFRLMRDPQHNCVKKHVHTVQINYVEMYVQNVCPVRAHVRCVCSYRQIEIKRIIGNVATTTDSMLEREIVSRSIIDNWLCQVIISYKLS